MDLLSVVAAVVVVVQVVLRVVGSMLLVQAALQAALLVVVLSEVLDLELELRWEEVVVVGGAISPLPSIFSLSSPDCTIASGFSRDSVSCERSGTSDRTRRREGYLGPRSI